MTGAELIAAAIGGAVVVALLAVLVFFAATRRTRRRFWIEYNETRDSIRATQADVRRGGRPKAGRFKL